MDEMLGIKQALGIAAHYDAGCTLTTANARVLIDRLYQADLDAEIVKALRSAVDGVLDTVDAQDITSVKTALESLRRTMENIGHALDGELR